MQRDSGRGWCEGVIKIASALRVFVRRGMYQWYNGTRVSNGWGYRVAGSG